MNPKAYKDAVDAVSFRPDFVENTLSLLEARRKEKTTLKKLPWKVICVAAALVAALAVTASAAVFHFLTPAQVAREAGNAALADAFERDLGAAVDDTRTVGGYQVTFMGLTSGANLSRSDADKESTYAVLACRRADGAAITDSVPEITVTPLVEGFASWEVNAWTLGGGAVTFARDGVLYYLFSCDTPQPCDGGNSYLAVYPGEHTPPDGQRFAFDAETGAISFRPGQEGVLFPLPKK